MYIRYNCFSYILSFLISDFLNVDQDDDYGVIAETSLNWINKCEKFSTNVYS